MPDLSRRLARYRVRLGFIAAALGFWLARPTARSLAVGAAVAGAVYLLCLHEAAMINGHTLTVDGGFAISG